MKSDYNTSTKSDKGGKNMERAEFYQAQQRFDRLYKEMDDLYHDLAVGLGLSDSALNVFCTIYTLGDGCLQRDICQRSYTSKQTIHSSVQRLCVQGYLRMEPGKGRDMHLYLTEAGRALMEERIRPVAEAELRTFAALTAEEQEALLRLTEKYVRCLLHETESLRHPKGKRKEKPL